MEATFLLVAQEENNFSLCHKRQVREKIVFSFKKLVAMNVIKDRNVPCFWWWLYRTDVWNERRFGQTDRGSSEIDLRKHFFIVVEEKYMVAKV